MGKRRGNGEGSIRKRADGRWEGRYTVGTDYATGKRIVKSIFGKSQAEVRDRLRKAIEENRGPAINFNGDTRWANGCGCGSKLTPSPTSAPAP